MESDNIFDILPALIEVLVTLQIAVDDNVTLWKFEETRLKGSPLRYLDVEPDLAREGEEGGGGGKGESCEI